MTSLMRLVKSGRIGNLFMTLAGSSHSGLMSYLPEGSCRMKHDLLSVLRLGAACVCVKTRTAATAVTTIRRLEKSRFILSVMECSVGRVATGSSQKLAGETGTIPTVVKRKERSFQDRCRLNMGRPRRPVPRRPAGRGASRRASGWFPRPAWPSGPVRRQAAAARSRSPRSGR